MNSEAMNSEVMKSESMQSEAMNSQAMNSESMSSDAINPDAARQAGAVRRPICDTCQRPQTTCICQWITPVRSAIELLILQHPLEAGHAKGSARLLHLCVQASQLSIGETFEPALLDALLHAHGRHPVLLYPELPGQQSLGLAPAPPLDPALLASPGQVRLIVLDASWRKSRKMLYLNPGLQSLPRLTLQAMPPSHYRIRKAHAPDQLSSMEAAAYAMMRLDPRAGHYAALLESFDGFVAQQEQQGGLK